MPAIENILRRTVQVRPCMAICAVVLGLFVSSPANACLIEERWSDERHRTYQARLWENAETVYILRVDRVTWEPQPEDTVEPSVSPAQIAVTPILMLKGTAELPAPFVIRESGGGCVAGPFARSDPGDLFVSYASSPETIAAGGIRGDRVAMTDIRDASTLAAWDAAKVRASHSRH